MPYPPIVLDRAASLPLYRQIEVALRRSILDGRIGPGARLPGIRAYARHLGVGAVTVMTAYEQLTAEGYLEARPGRGTLVAPGLPDLRGGLRPRSLPGRGPADEAVVLPEASAGPRRPFFEGTHSRPRFDFRTGSTSLDLFPSAVWERLLPRAWRDLASDPEPATTYRWPEGDPRLRAELAAYLGMSRAVRATPEQVVVTAGAQGAFATAARLWLSDGRTLATEDPSSPHLRRTFDGLGVETIPVPVDDRGLLVDRLPDGPSAVLVTPSWQYPNGGTMPVARRMHLLAWADRNRAIVIEDDCDSELRYEGHPQPSLQGLDEAGRVLYVGTFSKVLYPGLRLGCAVVPASAAEVFVARHEALYRGPGALEQRALALFLAEGHFERHLARLRAPQRRAPGGAACRPRRGARDGRVRATRGGRDASRRADRGRRPQRDPARDAGAGDGRRGRAAVVLAAPGRGRPRAAAPLRPADARRDPRGRAAARPGGRATLARGGRGGGIGLAPEVRRRASGR